MADMVQSALRRKLAAARVVGDLERIDVLRRMMTVPADLPAEAPADVPVEVPAEAPAIVDPPIDEVIDDPPAATGDEPFPDREE